METVDKDLDNLVDRFKSMGTKHKSVSVAQLDPHHPVLLKAKQTKKKAGTTPPTFVKSFPTKEMTGVDPALTRLCATVASQLYQVKSANDFRLDYKDSSGDKVSPTVFLYDNSGPFEDTNPPFVVVVSGTTMILAWRGSVTAMDWDRDFAFSTACSTRWANVAQTVRVQGGYASLVESTLTLHENTIIQEIEAKKIEQLILTGHSLGGGVAQVAHVFLEGSLFQGKTPWNSLREKLTLFTISIEGPMTTVFVKSKKESENKKGLAFVNKIGANTCTTVFSMDPVPRMYGSVNFGLDVVDNVLENVEDKTPIPALTRFLVNMFLARAKQTEKSIAAYVKIAKCYRHIGKIIYYASPDATPQIFTDHDELNPGTGNLEGSPQFRQELPYVNSKKVIKEVLYNHMFLVTGPGLAYRVLGPVAQDPEYMIEKKGAKAGCGGFFS